MNSSEKNLELKNPPIVEAVVDISVMPDPQVNIDSLASQNIEFAGKFPIQKPIHKFEGRFNFSTEAESLSSHSKTMIGFSYKSDEQDVLIQRRINGFSYHKLGKYCGWEHFISPAMQYWLDYKESTLQKNLEIQRLGLRFVNIIEVNNTPKAFLKILLSNTKNLGKLSTFRYQYSLELNNDCSATVSLSPIDSEGNQYVLDIDVFKQRLPKDLTAEKIRWHFEQMRNEKNILFSNTLTPKGIKRYE